MRFKKINGQLQNVAEYSLIKKNIARLYSLIGNKKSGNQVLFNRELIDLIGMKFDLIVHVKEST